MPALPSPLRVLEWDRVAREYDRLVFDFGARGEHRPFIWIDGARRNVDQDTFGLPTTVGDPRMGPLVDGGEVHEAITCMAAVLGASLVGIDKSDQDGRDWVRMCQSYFNADNGTRIFQDYTRGGTLAPGAGPSWSFWYDLLPNILFFALASQYPRVPRMEELMAAAAERWRQAAEALGGDYWHTHFDFVGMRPVDNGKWREPDASAGVAWLQYMAWKRFGNEAGLRAARGAMDALLADPRNPSYEVLLPFGACCAARMNAELATGYDVGRLLGWCFNGTSVPRRGWGVIAERWGDYDVHGLQGSLTDGGGYAFAMNTFDMIAALVPLIRYDARFARAIGRWALHAASAARLFYPGELPETHQTCRRFTETVNGVIAYEGLRKGDTEGLRGGPDQPLYAVSPFAQGDSHNWGPGFPPISHLSLYGSSHVGLLGGIIRRTDDPAVLLWDCLRTDFFHDAAHPTFLAFNPYPRRRVPVEIDAGDAARDVYDAVSHSWLRRRVRGPVRLPLEPDAAAVLVLAPAGGAVERAGRSLRVAGAVVDFSCPAP
jgi:hypothetical protein